MGKLERAESKALLRPPTGDGRSEMSANRTAMNPAVWASPRRPAAKPFSPASAGDDAAHEAVERENGEGGATPGHAPGAPRGTRLESQDQGPARGLD